MGHRINKHQRNGYICFNLSNGRQSFSGVYNLMDLVAFFSVLASLLQFQVFFSTPGNDLNEFKDKAKKANSAYKWIKQNWRKIFVIIITTFALIVVLGTRYRGCFSDSG